MKNLSKPNQPPPNQVTQSPSQHPQRLNLEPRKNKSLKTKPKRLPNSQHKPANLGDPQPNQKQHLLSLPIRARRNQVNDMKQHIPITYSRFVFD